MQGCCRHGEALQRGAGRGRMELRTEQLRGRDRSRGRGQRWWLGGLLLAVAGVAWASLPSPSARAERPSRDEVEAAYLYNFGKFVRWPAGEARGPLVICVAAQESFAHAIGALVTGEQIDQRPLQVKALNVPGGVAGCSILFIGPMEAGRVDAFLAAAAGKPILTVGEMPDFLVRGGTIQFVMMEDHVRFSVNLNAANRGGLSLSSELLKVAVSVTGKQGGAR
jgi:YfiR/HmsC-like